MTSPVKLVAAFCTLMLAFTPAAFAADDEHGAAGHKHIALFLGAGKEELPNGTEHDAKAVGFEFEYRLSDSWGIGAVVEALDVDYRGNTVVVVPVSFHFGGGFRAFAGPGYEFKENKRKDKGVFRVGFGYEFHINEHWTIAPEVLNDFLGDDGKHGDTWLVGVAIGYGF